MIRSTSPAFHGWSSSRRAIELAFKNCVRTSTRARRKRIVVAIERHADLLLLDERRGRRTAAAAGLLVTGLLGVIAQAKRAGAIDAAKPILDELIQTARFWIAPGLYREVLAQLGESLQLP
jgi:predicted nucleic acid-binding protein